MVVNGPLDLKNYQKVNRSFKFHASSPRQDFLEMRVAERHVKSRFAHIFLIRTETFVTISLHRQCDKLIQRELEMFIESSNVASRCVETLTSALAVRTGYLSTQK